MAFLLPKWLRRSFCRNPSLSLTNIWSLLLILALCLDVLRVVESQAHDSLDCFDRGDCPDASHYVLTLVKRDDEFARQMAEDHGMTVKDNFLETRYFLAPNDEGFSRRRKRSVIESMQQHDMVVELLEDRPRVRRKRDYQNEDAEPFHGPLEKRQATQSFQQKEIPRLPFPDPLYQDQWYLVGRAVGGYDMNVREAWLLGYAGRNVSVSILDDGIQRDHLDLVQNYDPLASTDINDHDDDPTPQNNGDNKHGTRCAGEVAAVAGNNVCGVGVAFHAKIGGVRMLDGPVSDSVEAASLNLNQQHIDIYSASWGPEDDGKTFDGPGNLAQEAFYRGVKQGRGGKGNIFVWASGNGGSRQDSCSADGYTTSIYTLSISSATYDNHRPWYLEECPSTIATTYSSANINQPAIVTVDVPSGCTKMHTGTSASAPLAAGIIALALEANPSLTWRDTQHIVLRTANPTPLLNNAGWSINGVGRRISNKFGYGLMDAGALVKLAKVWTTVPEQHMCTYEYTLDNPRPRPLMGHFQMNFSLEVNGCPKGTPVLYLEHVQVITTIRFAKRGDLKLTLFSPMGTQSILLPPRPQDFNQNGFHKWPFLSVQMWGEDPRGIWTLMVESISTNPLIGGMFSDWSLLLYGTEDPAQANDQRYPAQPYQRNPQNTGIGLPFGSQMLSVPVMIVALQLFALILVIATSIYACCRYSAPAMVVLRSANLTNAQSPPETQIHDTVLRHSLPSTTTTVTALSEDTAATTYPTLAQWRRAKPKQQRFVDTVSQSFSQTTAMSIIRNANYVPHTETESSPLTFGDLRSAPDCHEECLVGCTESHSAAACFSCKHYTQSLRNRAGFKCVQHCDEGFFADGDKCKKCNVNCQSCNRSAEICASCHGAQLLVDVNEHYGHMDLHGKCVDECPAGLIKDYTNLIQAKCVLKKNPCSDGYYENIHGVCVACDNACAICHGPGGMQCDRCAAGFGNHSVGYCRPCCAAPSASSNSTQSSAPANTHSCEDCAHYVANGPSIGIFNTSSYDESGGAQFGRFLVVVGLVFLMAFFTCLLSQVLCRRWCEDGCCGGIFGGKGADLEYTPLKTASSDGADGFGMSNKHAPFDYTESSDEDGLDSDVEKAKPSTSQQTTNVDSNVKTKPSTSYREDIARLLDDDE